MAKGFIEAEDFIELRDALHKELLRRAKTIPDDVFIMPAQQGYKVVEEHAKKVFNNAYAIDGTQDWRSRAVVGLIVKTDDIDDSINYIKTLMSQNAKQ